MSERLYSRHHGDGLLVAEHGADVEQTKRALKDFDDRLRLVWEHDQATGRQVWNVVYVWSQEHPAHQVLTWRDPVSLEPWPLTSGIVDEVKRLRQVDTLKESDAANQQLRDRIDRDAYQGALEITADFERLDRAGRIHVPVRTRRFGAGG